VNNAGVMLLGPVERASTEDWRRMVEVNVYGLLWCTHAVLPLMREGGRGDIVNISSVAGRRANAGAAVYNLTKFGVTGFSEALRQEALHSNIRVTVVEPGMVETELQGHTRDPAVRRSMERNREEIGTPLSSEDVAREILHAVSQPEHVCINEIVVRPTRQAN
jgi:NADP-dependent 3-hydroxy acid dehydrogenase YdfG